MGTTRSRTLTTLAIGVIGAGCLLGLGAASPAGAQQDSMFGASQNFAVNFEGGSVESFVNALRQAAGDIPVNIIVSGHTEGLQLPAIILEHVNVRNAVKSLEHLMVEPYAIDVGMTDEGLANGVMSIAVVKRTPRGPQRNTAQNVFPEPENRLEVISLTELLEGTGEEGANADTATLLTAIDTALAMADDAQTAELKFHPDSHLLIVSGSARQTDLVKRLINEVHDDVIRRRQFTSQLKNEMRHAEIEAQKAEVEIQAARSDFEIARREFDQLKALRDSGMVGESEMMAAERQIQQIQSQMEIAELEREQRMTRLHAIAEQLDASEQRFAAPSTEEAIKAEIDRLRSRIRDLENRPQSDPIRQHPAPLIGYNERDPAMETVIERGRGRSATPQRRCPRRRGRRRSDGAHRPGRCRGALGVLRGVVRSLLHHGPLADQARRVILPGRGAGCDAPRGTIHEANRHGAGAGAMDEPRGAQRRPGPAPARRATRGARAATCAGRVHRRHRRSRDLARGAAGGARAGGAHDAHAQVPAWAHARADRASARIDLRRLARQSPARARSHAPRGAIGGGP